MKKLFVVFLSVLMLLSLCACSDTGGVYTVEKDGKTFEVDTVNSTVFDGTYTYHYSFMGDADSYSFDITYPNGSTYYWDQSGNSGHGGRSDDYDEGRYVSGETLRDLVAEKAPAPISSWKIIVPALLILIGGLNAAAPRAAWQLEYGWRYKNAEPSDTALALNRIGGIVAAIIGVVIILV